MNNSAEIFSNVGLFIRRRYIMYYLISFNVKKPTLFAERREVVKCVVAERARKFSKTKLKIAVFESRELSAKLCNWWYSSQEELYGVGCWVVLPARGRLYHWGLAAEAAYLYPQQRGMGGGGRGELLRRAPIGPEGGDQCPAKSAISPDFKWNT